MSKFVRCLVILIVVVTTTSLPAVFGAAFNVDIINFSFQPSSLNIQAGDTVTWTQKDIAPHTATSDTDIWASPILALNATFPFTFNNNGVYPYHCAVHPSMVASVTVGSVPANLSPVVSITSPAAGALLSAPATFTVQASASDPDGSVTQVQFFAGTTSLGVAMSSPYLVTVTSLPAGSYTLTAVATDNAGATTTSAPVTIVVSGNQPPVVSLSNPANGAVFFAPASVTLQAVASDSDGTVAKVEFFAGSNSLGVVTASPFNLTVPSLAAGAYSLTAVATDNMGAATASSPVNITVDQPPVVSLSNPTNGAVFFAPATFTLQAVASDSDGTVAKVEFFAGTNSLGVVTASPFNLTVPSLAAGAYSLTAVATDNMGATTASSPVNIAVESLTPVALNDPVHLDNGGFQFMVTAALSGTINIIQASTDLVNWTPIATNSVAFADWMFTDTTGTNVRYRFYRVLTPGAQ